MVGVCPSCPSCPSVPSAPSCTVPIDSPSDRMVTVFPTLLVVIVGECPSTPSLPSAPSLPSIPSVPSSPLVTAKVDVVPFV